MSTPAVRHGLAVDAGLVSAGLIEALYRIHDGKEDQANAFIRDLFRAVLRGNRWALQHAPQLLAAAEVVAVTADAACDAAIGTHVPGVVEALDDAQHQFERLFSETGAAKEIAIVAATTMA